MKIVILNREEIDVNRWNRCIDEAQNSLIYACSWFLDIVTNKKWKALISEDYRFIMPFAVNKKVFQYVYQPFFAQQFGVFSKERINADTIRAFFSVLVRSYKYVNTNLNFANFPTPDELYIKRANYVLDLLPDYETLSSRFSANHIRNIKKSYKYKLSLSRTLSVDKIIKLKQENLKNNLSVQSIETLRSILSYCSKAETLEVFAVHEKARLVAVTVFTVFNNRFYNILSASDEVGFEKRAAFLIFNEFIKSHAGSRFILDFEGSEIPGIARFFKGWGAKNSPYYRFQLNRLPLVFRLLKK